MKSILALGLLSIFSSSFAHGAIYGSDNRLLIGPNSPVKEIQRSVALGVLSSMQSTNADGSLDLKTESLVGKVCSSERYFNELSLKYSCTGFLIAPDLLLTAGHCSANVGVNEHDTENFCPLYSWVFDYAPGLDGKTSDHKIDPSRVFQCKEVIYAAAEEFAPFRDFSIIRLDRPATGRTPLKLSAETPKKSDALFLVGHPMGMPATVATNGRVLLNNPEKETMITNLDSFGGNSGSPVLNLKKEVVGILVGGFPSEEHYTNPAGTCELLNRCDDSGFNCGKPDLDLSVFPYYQATGAQVQKLGSVKEILKRLAP